MASQLLEQQEKLRRAVDEWRTGSHDLLRDLAGDPFSIPSFAPTTTDPIRLFVCPIEHSQLSTILRSDNVSLSKFVSVFSYDCIEISNLSNSASKRLFRQLQLFGHRSSPQEVLLEGEPQKAFGESLSLFIELYETTIRMAELLGNLLQQLNSVYSIGDKNVRPLNSIKNLMLRTAFEALGEGLAVFLVLDEIIKQNEHIKNYLSSFSRMLSKVKLEIDTFDITVEDIDLLDQVVVHFEKLLEVNFFKWLVYKESSWLGIMQQVKGNKKFIDGCFSCIHDGLVDILLRLDTWKELPVDRLKILQHMALFIFSTHVSDVIPEKKLVKMLLDMLHLSPLLYIRGKRIMLVDVLKEQSPSSLSSWLFLREAIRDRNLMINNYLKRLNDIHSRDWQTIKDTLSCWVASFHSTVHPVAELLSEGWLRIHQKKTIQGLVVASRLQLLIQSILDLHALLEVPIKREKLKSLCHMIISLKVLEQTFQTKGSDMIKSLPHTINIIQADLEQIILPSKDMLQIEVDKRSQINQLGFFSSLTRRKETDTRLTDSLSLVHMLLQMLQGGGSHKRQLIFLNILDVLQSIGYLNIDFTRVRKLTSKLWTLVGFQAISSAVVDSSFLYWRREMMGSLFSMVYVEVGRFSWLQYLIDAFSDGLKLLKLGQVGKHTLEAYQNEIEYGVKNEIIIPLCRDIENDLRLHVHSTYFKGSVVVNPTKTGVRNLAWYLAIKPLHLSFKFIDISSHVENYLNSAFYNHSTMPTYDRKIYLEMQLLAELKYGLMLDDVYFVGNSMVHDIGINETVQDLCAFTKNYTYNIIKQVFIDKIPKGKNRKNLRLIGVEDITHSVSIHGLQVIYKASDSIQKFLEQMFTNLSQLLKNKCRTDSSNDYILKNNKEIVSRLPFLKQDHEASFLEPLNVIMSQIGNALGLVRILLAGSSRHICNISRPTLDMSFEESYQKLGLADEILEAGRVMDKAIAEKYEPVARMESFSDFINRFVKEHPFGTEDHAKDLSQIVPSIIVNLVSAQVRYKDNLLLDHDSENTLYMHDSLFMGVAFALKVSAQESSFDDLNWFGSARKSLEERISSLELTGSSKAQDTNSRVGSSLARWKLWSQTSPIPLEIQKGLDECIKYQKEIELVEYVLNAARAFIS
ncbi:WASH complex subunit 4-like isoform X2 [Zingiber officinale]|uniref:WASH complex subunit 4-like isoform X2 n=1 Tax=Zingiber officinale TaxID=94328 RepID=UPI001C4B763F|nr:WASH complex subunit 4-like isoform X2 [Zingiber officinale]